MAWLCLLTVAGFGAAGVVLLALGLHLIPRYRNRSSGALLAASHTLIVLLFLLLAPLCIAAEWGSPYGDIYGPYLLVPGIHIYHPAGLLFGEVVFPWLLGYMKSFPASVICVVVGPGLIALFVGGLQWYILGAIWDRWHHSAPSR
jgi:hypothetical protein